MNNIQNILFSVLLLLVLFFLPLNSFGFEIPEVGEGVCVLNCPEGNPITPNTPKPTPTPAIPTSNNCPNDCSSNGICVNGVCDCFSGFSGTDCSMSAIAAPAPPPPPPIIVSNLETTVELGEQVLEKLKEEDYTAVLSILNTIIESLTKAKEDLITDPELEKFREDLRKLAQVDKLLGSSIKNHQKASSNINRLAFEHTGGRTKQRLLQDSEKRIKRGLILTKTAGSVITRGVLGG